MVAATVITKAIIDAAHATGGSLDFDVDVSTWSSSDITKMIDDVIDASSSATWKVKGVRASANIFTITWPDSLQYSILKTGVPVVIDILTFDKVELLFKP